MKIAVIGNGSIGRRHLRGLSKLKDNLGIKELRSFDTNPERVKQVQQETPNVLTASSVKEAATGADTIFMCVPTSLHIPLYQEIKPLGDFNFFVEKPLSHSIAGCEQMIFDQERKGKNIAVGYMLHHHPVLKRAKELIDTGAVGRILSVRAEAGFYLPQWHPWEDYRDFYMSWKTGGGGALLDISHEIDYLQWLFGEIEEVQGMMGTISDLEITSDDLALAIFKFKSGIFGQLQLDLLQFEESRYCKIIGTEGVLKADIVNNKIIYNTKSKQDWITENISVDFDDIYLEEYQNVISYFNGTDSEVVTGKQAY